MFHTTMDARLCSPGGSRAISGAHSAPCRRYSSEHVLMLMGDRHGIGNLLRPEKYLEGQMKSIFKISKLKVAKLSLSVSKISQFNVFFFLYIKTHYRCPPFKENLPGNEIDKLIYSSLY